MLLVSYKNEDVFFRHRYESTALSKLPTFTLRRDPNSAATGTGNQRSDKTFPSEDDSTTVRGRFWTCPALPSDFGYCECGGSTVESGGGGHHHHRGGLQDEFLYNLSPPVTAFGNPGHVFDYVIDGDSNFQVAMDTGTEEPLQRGVGIQRDEDGGEEDQRSIDPDYFFSQETVQRCPVGGERAPACHVMPVGGGSCWGRAAAAEETKALTSEYCERDVTRNAINGKMELISNADQMKESEEKGKNHHQKTIFLSLKLKATSCNNHYP